jgi:diaminopimelate epimerase
MHFAKYHGLGNDFLIVDLRAGAPTPSPEDAHAAERLCDRHRGVGGDGVLALLPPISPGAHARMRVLNADGGEAEMCGNGLRCVVKYLHERDPSLALPALTIDTGAGPLTCAVEPAHGRAETVTVDMGRPRLTRAEIPMLPATAERCIAQPFTVDGVTLDLTAVSMGNPHAIAFVPQAGAALRALAERLGPPLEVHPAFPRKTNVELARLAAPDHIELVVWERGCGITQACGTGACATVVAACLGGHTTPGREIRVTLLGGDLFITVAPDYSTVHMRGPALHVYDADIDLAALLA